MATVYKSTLLPQVIYVFRICDEDHKGCLKIGMTKLIGDDIDVTNLPENCDVLKDIARSRIDEYTSTAATHYELLHVECSLFFNKKGVGSFDDHQVHEILLRSGVRKKEFSYNEKAREWFITDLQTVKNAISAAKQGRKALTPSEVSYKNSPIEFRPEQCLAIEKAVEKFKVPGTKMLWNCKMRFGKTLSALEVIKRMQFRMTIIVTHRPVVDASWFEDYDKIFYDQPHFRYGSKNNGEDIDALLNGKHSFIYFASLQDLRGSSEVGGNFDKNKEILSAKWDLLIVDEAHEGTQTELGQKVLKRLKKKNTCVMDLSGTPFNIVSDYEPDEIVNWTYVDEQRAKAKWEEEHPCDYNPYGSLPRMNMAIYDLNEVFDNYEAKSGDVQFNFREFFRVWSGDPLKDGRRMPADAQLGKFIHEGDVKKFLDLLVKPDPRTNYPFSTEEYRNIFRHTFWVLPGVPAAKALSALLKKHPVFSMFEVVNVAGEGDDDSERADALDAVLSAIGDHPEETYTITLSCARLTTGVTIKPWTAVFMLYGATKTKAQGYMQTIFRVQSPAVIGGKRKEECYVFDFAPDRIITSIDETIRAASYSKGSRLSAQKATITDEERNDFKEFIHFCPVIAYDGSQMRPYDVTQLLDHLKRVQIERVVRNGFDDDALYNNEILMNLDTDALNELEDIKGIIGTSKAAEKTGDFIINEQGLDGGEEPYQKNKKAPLTPEEAEERREKARRKKQKKDAISILKGISIRFPMLIYGADVKDEEVGVTIENFTSFVDKESWKEFMPEGITMQKFYALRKYYDPDVFRACGKRIRAKAKSADELPPLERIYKIEDILSTFRNPDKETVITPWRVVNLHLSNTIGGYDFYDEEHQFLLEEPRKVDRGRPTYRIFETENPLILEINSKSGRYPLYMAYSIYRERLKQWCVEGVIENPKAPTLEEQQTVWDDVIANNILILCKTPMAEKITKRTLVGYRNVKVNTRHIEGLAEKILTNMNEVAKKIRQGKSFWQLKTDNNMIQFDAIVSNPPYQDMDGGGGSSATPLYNRFVELSKALSPKYASLITPARWMTGGRFLEEYRANMLKERHLAVLYDYFDPKACFRNVAIEGGICYFLWDKDNEGKCSIFTQWGNGHVENSFRFLQEQDYDIYIRDHNAISILYKVVKKAKFTPFSTIVRPRNYYNMTTIPKTATIEEDKIRILGLENRKRVWKYLSEFKCSKKEFEEDMLTKWKVFASKADGAAGQLCNPVPARIIGQSEIGVPNSICTITFLAIGPFETEMEAKNVQLYMTTKFFRFLIGVRKNKNMYWDNYAFVPILDWTKAWTDEELYKTFEFSEKEIQYIEQMISPLQIGTVSEEEDDDDDD